jgi:hypothetical protein
VKWLEASGIGTAYGTHRRSSYCGGSGQVGGGGLVYLRFRQITCNHCVVNTLVSREDS